MKKLKYILLIILYTISNIISSGFCIYANEINDTENVSLQASDLSAESAVLMDLKTGTILFDKNMNDIKYPASITKVLTSILILENENYNPEDIVTVSYNATYNIGAGGSNMALKENEQISMQNLFYGILLKSANDACVAVAEHLAGSSEDFVELMNEKAQEIGALNTHFANTHGYHDQNHYTTAYDMALIMREALKYEEFVKMISTTSYTIPATNLSDERTLTNSNKLILEDSPYYYEYCVGGKTGYTDQAGNTLVSYAKKDDMELICVVLKSQGSSMYTDTISLFEYGFSSYTNTQLFDKEDFSQTVSVVQNYNDEQIFLGEVTVTAEDNVFLNIPSTLDKSLISTKINLNSPLVAPISAGDTLGSIDFLYNDDIIASVNITTTEEMLPISEKKLDFKNNVKSFLAFLFKVLLILMVIIIFIIFIGFISRAYFKYRKRKKRYLFKGKYKRR